MTVTQASVRNLAQAMSDQRRSLASKSPHAFAQVYLDHHFVEPPSRMHLELFDQLEKLTLERGSRLAVAAPRGHAKTTVVSLAYVLWCLLYRREMFILIVSATREQAVQIMSDLTRELKGNSRLMADFPEISGPVIAGRALNPSLNPTPGTPPHPAGTVKVRSHHLALPNGSCVRVLGVGQGIRGMKHGQHRPSLIIGDDLEELEQTMSDEQRRKTLDWFHKTLLKAGTVETNVVVVGTILHYDSLLANLTREQPQPGKAGGWTGAIYQAVESFSKHPGLWDRWESIRFGLDEHEGKRGVEASRSFLAQNREAMLSGTRVLWPEREPYDRLMEIRVDEGRNSFQSEKQNEPLDPEQCLFREERFVYWDTPSGRSGLTTESAPVSGGPSGGWKGYVSPKVYREGPYRKGHPGQAVDFCASHGFAGSAELIQSLGPHARIYGAVDPSLGERGTRGDFSAVITLVKDTRTGVMHVIGASIERRLPDELIETIVKLNKTYEYSVFGVETNLFRGVFAEHLKERCRQSGRRLNMKRIENTRNKQLRVSSIEPLVTQGQLRFSIEHTRLLEQLRRFPLASHDDGPDALEMAVRVAQAEVMPMIIEPL